MWPASDDAENPSFSVIKDLKNNGVPESNIININFDKRGFKNIKTADKLEEVIDGYITDDEKKYIFLDEIQNVKGFEEVINAYREDGHSIFITGSNSYLLSVELMTKLTGRYENRTKILSRRFKYILFYECRW